MALKKGSRHGGAESWAVWVEAQAPVPLHLQLPRAVLSRSWSGTTALGWSLLEKGQGRDSSLDCLSVNGG